MRYRFLAIGLLSWVSVSWGHQPVMDMAPRWQGGYGFQVMQECYGSNRLLSGTEESENSRGLERHVSKTRFEGVYTFDRSKRVTFKLPYVVQRRRRLDGDDVVTDRGEGWGDPILAAPLKNYWNLSRSTMNIGMTPAVRIPIGGSTGAFPVSDGSWDRGLGLSWSGEGYIFPAWPNFNFYYMVDGFRWFNGEGTDGVAAPDELGLDINIGFRLFHDRTTGFGSFLMWDVTARSQEVPGLPEPGAVASRVHSGPALVLYRRSVMARLEYRRPVYEDAGGSGLSRGNDVLVGIGMVF